MFANCGSPLRSNKKTVSPDKNEQIDKAPHQSDSDPSILVTAGPAIRSSGVLGQPSVVRSRPTTLDRGSEAPPSGGKPIRKLSIPKSIDKFQHLEGNVPIVDERKLLERPCLKKNPPLILSSSSEGKDTTKIQTPDVAANSNVVANEKKETQRPSERAGTPKNIATKNNSKTVVAKGASKTTDPPMKNQKKSKEVKMSLSGKPGPKMVYSKPKNNIFRDGATQQPKKDQTKKKKLAGAAGACAASQLDTAPCRSDEDEAASKACLVSSKSCLNSSNHGVDSSCTDTSKKTEDMDSALIRAGIDELKRSCINPCTDSSVQTISLVSTTEIQNAETQNVEPLNSSGAQIECPKRRNAEEQSDATTVKASSSKEKPRSTVTKPTSTVTKPTSTNAGTKPTPTTAGTKPTPTTVVTKKECASSITIEMPSVCCGSAVTGSTSTNVEDSRMAKDDEKRVSHGVVVGQTSASSSSYYAPPAADNLRHDSRRISTESQAPAGQAPVSKIFAKSQSQNMVLRPDGMPNDSSATDFRRSQASKASDHVSVELPTFQSEPAVDNPGLTLLENRVSATNSRRLLAKRKSWFESLQENNTNQSAQTATSPVLPRSPLNCARGERGSHNRTVPSVPFKYQPRKLSAGSVSSAQILKQKLAVQQHPGKTTISSNNASNSNSINNGHSTPMNSANVKPSPSTGGSLSSSMKPDSKSDWLASLLDTLKRKKRVAVYIILYIFAATFNTIYFKKMTNVMPNYAWFCTQMTTLVYVPVFTIMFISESLAKSTMDTSKQNDPEAGGAPSKQNDDPKSRLSNPNPNATGALLVSPSVGTGQTFLTSVVKTLHWAWELTPIGSTAHLAQKNVIIMGALDSFASVTMVLGGIYTTGATQVLLLQGAIPTTLILSAILLRRQYHWYQYFGALIIVLAVVISKIGSGNAMDRNNNDTTFNLVFASSNLPTAISTIYKEVAFQSSPDLSIYLVQFWVAIWQIVCGVVWCPIYSFDFLGPQKVEMSEMWQSFVSGFSCFLGHNTIKPPLCGDPTSAGLAGRNCDDCSGAMYAAVCYCSFNVGYNCFTMLLVKHGSASLFTIINGVRLPVTSLLFSSTLIMGAAATPMMWNNWVALVVLLIGLALYKQGGRLLKRQQRSAALADGSQTLSKPLLEQMDAIETNRNFPLCPIGPGGACQIEPMVEIEITNLNLVRTPDQIRTGYMRSLGVIPKSGMAMV